LKGKILVIDDTKNIKMMIGKILSTEGYQVDLAENGHEGLVLFNNTEYDLVLLDIRMPHMNGTEVLKLIKENKPDTSVIIITAYPTIKNAVDCIKLGAVDYLRKPFSAEKIKHVVEKIIERDNLTSLNTDSYELAIEYAKKCINKRNFDEAINFLKKAVSIKIDGAEPFNLLGNVFELREDFSDAKKYYNIALQFEPENEVIVENIKRIKDR
jgi:DNA-binding NtrC family response regulator